MGLPSVCCEYVLLPLLTIYGIGRYFAHYRGKYDHQFYRAVDPATKNRDLLQDILVQ